MLYSNSETKILVTDNRKTMSEAFAFFKEETNESEISDNELNPLFFLFRFKLKTKHSAINIPVYKVNSRSFVIYKDDISKFIAKKLTELEDRLKAFRTDEFEGFLGIQHNDEVNKERSELDLLADEIYSIKKIKEINQTGNIMYSIENIAGKLMRYERLSMKFKKTIKYKDEGTSFVVKTPNLKPFKLRFDKYGETEFFQKAFISCLFFKFLFDKTKTAIYLRIYLNLKIVLQVFRINRDKLNEFALTDKRLKIIIGQFDEIRNTDSTTADKDIYKFMNETISYYSKSKKERRKEENLVTLESDLMSTIDDMKKHDSSVQKPFIRKPILSLMKKYRKSVLKFVCEIGFNKEYFDNYKNNERIIS